MTSLYFICLEFVLMQINSVCTELVGCNANYWFHAFKGLLQVCNSKLTAEQSQFYTKMQNDVVAAALRTHCEQHQRTTPHLPPCVHNAAFAYQTPQSMACSCQELGTREVKPDTQHKARLTPVLYALLPQFT